MKFHPLHPPWRLREGQFFRGQGLLNAIRSVLGSGDPFKFVREYAPNISTQNGFLREHLHQNASFQPDLFGPHFEKCWSRAINVQKICGKPLWFLDSDLQTWWVVHRHGGLSTDMVGLQESNLCFLHGV